MKQLWLARVGPSYEGAFWNGVFDDRETALKHAKAYKRETRRYKWKKICYDEYRGEYWEYLFEENKLCDAWLKIVPVTLNKMTDQ
jgi:hypothetical protein